MRVVLTIILVVLTFLAVSSGVTKIMLMQQDVEFFARYGFSETMLIVFGVTQLIGGFLLPFPKTRFSGAAIVAMTFLVSLILLIMDGNIPLSAVTAVATGLLGFVMVRSRRAATPKS